MKSFSRRELLQESLKLAGLGIFSPNFLRYTSALLQDQTKVQNNDRILVVLQLAGGNDGLNTLVPYRDDLYYKLRPKISIAANSVLQCNTELGLHPSAMGLKSLFDEGRLAIVQGVGYPNPNRSHFVSTDIWACADPTQREHYGWLGRHLDCAQEHSPVTPRSALSLTGETPLTLLGKNFRPICFDRPEQLRWNSDPSNTEAEEIFEKLQQTTNGNSPDKNSKMLDAVRKAAADAEQSAGEIRKALGESTSKKRRGRFLGRATRQNSLSEQLTQIVQLIEANLGTRIYYLSLGGFDTHSGQLGRHQNLMKQLGEGLLSFSNLLHEKKLEERVLLLTFSEFGRRVEENASGGTDHGTAAPLFLLGSKLKPGLHGKPPRLDQLENGDLSFTTDFRSVYASVLENWFEVNSTIILGKKFPKLELL